MRRLIGAPLVRRLTRVNRDIRDTRLPGFLVRCRASGAHSYVVVIGRGRAVTLGRVGLVEPTAARVAARALLAKVALGEDPIAARRAAKAVPTWSAFLEDTYAPWLRANRRSADETIRKLTVSFAGLASLRLNELSAFGAERWRTARLKAGASPITANRDLDDAKAALARAVEWGLLAVNPFAKVKRSRVDRTPIVRYLSGEEETRLRAALLAREDRRRAERASHNVWLEARGDRPMPAYSTYTDHLQPLVLLALHTGCRRGELFNLEWRDVDFVGARLTVRGAGAKNGQTRVIPLNSEARAVLQAWQPTPAPARAYVFPGDDGDRLTTIKTAWTALLEDAAITGFRFHDCRHHFASRLVQAGVDLNTVRELLGHADLKMTVRYTHLAPEHHAAAVAKLIAVG